jgi:hypothetical protein
MQHMSRDVLYEMVWAEPVRTVAVKIGISDTAVRKICIKANVPIPKRGYWAKVAAGKVVGRTPLPLRAPGAPEYVGEEPRRPWSWQPDPVAELAEPEPREPSFGEPLAEVEMRIRKVLRRVAAERNLDSPHGAIRRILDEEERKRGGAVGKSYVLSWEQPQFDSPFERRRLRVLSALFVGLSQMGCKPWVSGGPARSVGAVVGKQHVGFSLDHPKAKPNRHGEPQVHGGKIDTLRFEIACRAPEGKSFTWQDSDSENLEHHLTDMVASVVLAGEIQYRSGRTSNYEWAMKRREEMRQLLARQRAEAEEAERRRVARHELNQRMTLMRQAKSWRMANDLRAFIASVVDGAPSETSPDVEVWAKWGRDVADRMDPLAQPGQLLAKISGQSTGPLEVSEEAPP